MLCGFDDSFAHFGVVVAHDHRAPRKYVVDIAFAVCIPDIGTVRPLHEAGCTAYGLEGPHGRVHAAGDVLLGSLKKLFGSGHGAWACLCKTWIIARGTEACHAASTNIRRLKRSDVHEDHDGKQKQHRHLVEEPVKHVCFIVFAPVDAAHIDTALHVVGNQAGNAGKFGVHPSRG